MGINHPLNLFFLLLGVYFFFVWRQSFKAFTPRQQRAFLGLRLLLLTLLVLALAGLQLNLTHRGKSVVYVADVSASIADRKQEAANWIGKSIAALPRDTMSGVVSLGKKGMVEYPVSMGTDFKGLQAVVDNNYTDLAAGLRLARSLLPEGRGKQLVLLTDGKQNRNDALDLAKALRQQGVRLDVLPLQTTPGPEVLVKDITVPSRLLAGESFNLQLSVESTSAGTGIVRLTVDNKILRQEEVQLSKGSNKLVWGLKAEGPGLHTYKAEVNSPQDTRPQNNSGAAVTEVAGPPRILLVEGQEADGEAIGRALHSVGLDADRVEAQAMPKNLAGLAKYSAVILANVPATEEGTMNALESYVRDLGRGLVMVGGEDSFGLGGYYKTPVERALPVHMDIRKKGEIPSLGLGLVIDKSGSMCHTMNGVSKMDMAKEAAIRATQALEEKDQLGVITFDSEHKWVVKTSPVSNRREIEDKIGSIRPGGGTNMFPALQAAYLSLKEADVKVKHIILLSDGVSPSGGDYDDLIAKMQEAKITLTTVAVGSDSDTGLLARLAKEGKGRYYYTDDIASIPQIFAKETFLASRSYLVQETFTPAVRSGAGILPAGGLPRLYGYVATTAKDNSEVVLASHQDDPVLARWQYGLGRSVAWTSDAKGRWAGEWVSWNGFPQMWGKLINWVLPQNESGGMVLTTYRDGGEAKINVELPGERRQVSDLQAKLVAPDGASSEITLPAVGPGRYQGSFPLDQQGTYLVQAVQRSGERVVRQQTAAVVQSYSPEYLLQQDQGQFLQSLAEAGGGRVLEPGEPAETVGQLPVAPVKGSLPLQFDLLLLAAVILPLDIAARRFNLHLSWVKSLRLKLKAFGAGSEGEHAFGPLSRALKRDKLARERFYRERSGGDKNVPVHKDRAITGAGNETMTNAGQEKMVKAHKAPVTGGGKKAITNTHKQAESGGKNQDDTEAKAKDSFTSRLLAAKKRRND